MSVFTAILRSYQLLNDQVNGVMKRHGFTFVQYQVLAWLETDPESSLTLSWISKTLRIPPATVTDIIDRLEDDRLVRRVPHPSDARTTLAVITAKGRRAANEATQELNATVYEGIGLTEDQRGELVALLAQLRANGNEFDVEHSDDVIEEVESRGAKTRGTAERFRGGLDLLNGRPEPHAVRRVPVTRSCSNSAGPDDDQVSWFGRAGLSALRRAPKMSSPGDTSLRCVSKTTQATIHR